MLLCYAINTAEGTRASTGRLTFSRCCLRPKTTFVMRRLVRKSILQVADQLCECPNELCEKCFSTSSWIVLLPTCRWALVAAWRHLDLSHLLCVLADSRPPDKTRVINRMTNELVVKRNTVWTDRFGYREANLAYLISVLIASESDTFYKRGGKTSTCFWRKAGMTGNAYPPRAPPDLVPRTGRLERWGWFACSEYLRSVPWRKL